MLKHPAHTETRIRHALKPFEIITVRFHFRDAAKRMGRPKFGAR